MGEVIPLTNKPTEPQQKSLAEFFSLHDCVRLRSGGPNMLVVGFDDGEVVCAFFNNEDCCLSNYRPSCLDMVARTQKFEEYTGLWR